jgi:hypothetical protein
MSRTLEPRTLVPKSVLVLVVVLGSRFFDGERLILASWGETCWTIRVTGLEMSEFQGGPPVILLISNCNPPSESDLYGHDSDCGLAALFVCRMNRDGSNGPGNCRPPRKPDCTFRSLNTIESAIEGFCIFRWRSLPSIQVNHRHSFRGFSRIRQATLRRRSTFAAWYSETESCCWYGNGLTGFGPCPAAGRTSMIRHPKLWNERYSKSRDFRPRPIRCSPSSTEPGILTSRHSRFTSINCLSFADSRGVKP